jgi:FkbM family methyltransferase
MKIPPRRAIVKRIRTLLRRVRPFQQAFLPDTSGVIHVGANIGQERDLYERFGVRVLWIEPIPDIIAMLEARLEGHDRQRAVEGLVTDRDDVEYPFHIASNRGQSSSILELERHREIWPGVSYTGTITLKSVTLATLLHRARIEAADYDALVIDTQGSELLVLKGAEPLLHNFKYVMTEVADFESYQGCCRLADIDSFMTRCGYREFKRTTLVRRAGVGSYFEVLYRRTGA